VCTPAEHCPIDWLRPARCERAYSLHSACRSRPPHVARSGLCAPSSAREMVSARREEIRRLRALLKRATFVVALQHSRVILPQCLFSELGALFIAARAHQRLTHLLTTRYMLSRRNRIPKCTDWRDRVLCSLPPSYFIAHLRVEPSTFAYLVTRLDSTATDIFHRPSGRPQLSVRIQLAIAPFRFGHYGSGASALVVAQRFGVSPSTVVNATHRVLSAILRWEAGMIRWPTAVERQAHSRDSEERYGFKGCIGAVDGTTIPFAYAPSVDPWCFFDRHKRCSVNVLVACDWDLRITSLVQAFTGAVPDTVVQATTPWHAHPELYFSDGEYLVGDKSMLGSDRVLLPHKGPGAYIRANQNYNYQHARRRISAEMVIGVLKGRFGSLKELRTPVASDADFTRVMEWVAACSVLHNVCIGLDDIFPHVEPADRAANATGESLAPLPPAAGAARSRVQQQVLRFMIAQGLYHG